MFQRPCLILSLPLAVAILISTSLYYLSTTAETTPSAAFFRPPSSVERDRFHSLFANGVLSSSSWPRIPLQVSTASPTSFPSSEKIASEQSVGATMAPCDSQESVAWVATEDLDIEDDEEEEKGEEYDEEDCDDDQEKEEEEEGVLREWDAVLHFPGGQTVHVGNDLEASDIAELIEEVEERMLATVPRGMESQNVVVLDLSPTVEGELTSDEINVDSLESDDELVVLNLSRRGSRDEEHEHRDHKIPRHRKQELNVHGSNTDEGDHSRDDDDDAEDEDDHFPTNLKHGGDKQDDDADDVPDEDKDKDDHDHDRKHRHHGDEDEHHHKHHHQDQNANLGGTGANGPILLCSSRSCLPKLRDSILSKLSVQIQYVMDHLRNRETLFYGMESTAPQTKESLIAAQEEMVQQLEDRITKDLKNWVMGVGRKSGGASSSSPSSKTKDGSKKKEKTTTAFEVDEIVAEMTVESEGLFLGGEDFETEGDITSSAASSNGFHMRGLSLEDKVLEDKISKKKYHTLQKRDGQQNDFFLSADKVLMQEEWSRWIRHWVHHAKLLILSHSLATRTLADMNQIAIAGENVVTADQRHWSWNLDKALAIVMVASEMLCGSPPASMTTTTGSLATLKMAAGSDATTLKALALTLSAQKCVDVWSPELETILQHTATNA